MSTVQVSYARVECDGCKVVHGTLAVDITAARIAAAKDGWKYATRKTRAREVFDACPGCEIPDGYQETP